MVFGNFMCARSFKDFFLNVNLNFRTIKRIESFARQRNDLYTGENLHVEYTM